MLMSVIARCAESVATPEITGSRVLISGLTSTSGFDIARTFADHGARLVVQSPDDGPEMTELGAVLAENAAEVRLFNDPLTSDEDARRLVQTTAQDFGGLDAVVNLVSVEADAIAALETMEDVEGLVAETLRIPFMLTECAANRMRLVWAEGMILNVVRIGPSRSGRAMMFADVLRARLADMTRGLAEDWADAGIRVNAIAPPSSVAAMSGDVAASDADLATVALDLASRKARSVTGHVLDAEGAARRWC
ncbi:hypothetical protein W911_09680 [Hyphomicrobium nitrativorans NL23]|uniref:Short-chain dehydrogenase n=1 Tax=Hyphomicrobium nitrativorans NL23 TaxID=1029756 RepID=V5SDJ1_9HYPH|nr:SDR family oxidoreductase [Hyphomicrobium nitrativorans]AHB48598.1 hypothetical protein W911_09680 [Hyphomicrobium nitrativorans NL23]